jgi:hypothetical protein
MHCLFVGCVSERTVLGGAFGNAPYGRIFTAASYFHISPGRTSALAEKNNPIDSSPVPQIRRLATQYGKNTIVDTLYIS